MASFDSETPGVDYTTLQAATGVDFDKLRRKYTPIAESRDHNFQGAAAATLPPSTAAAAAREPLTAQQLEGMERLGRMFKCGDCDGFGLRKVIYNHMVREQNCERCDGEGVITLEKPAALVQAGDRSGVAEAEGQCGAEAEAEAAPPPPM